MPYIQPINRPQYEDVLRGLPIIQTKGDLEFCIFYLMRKFMWSRTPRYSTLHEAAYAATHCADEFRRRFLDAREDEARRENGDVPG
jgi:hypothetical protein